MLPVCAVFTGEPGCGKTKGMDRQEWLAERQAAVVTVQVDSGLKYLTGLLYS